MNGISSEPAPAEEHLIEVAKDVKVAKDTKDAKDAENACVEKKKRVVRKREKLSSAAAEVPAATEAPVVDAKFFGKLGSTLRDLRREAKAQKFSSFVVA
jgi:preprotein translocase subunit SecD